jgi:23S rRNA (cytidine1920-2'-O)/16S rRNA (cytidine1409-2'-O)-methyltransferase
VAKTRLDIVLVQRGLTPSREQAQRLIMAGEVTVGGQVILRPATPVDAGAEIVLKAKPPYVSRGGEKLAAALAAFQLAPTGWVCADIGASTGGFTDCLLQQGAARVYAIDVGHGILDFRLRQDPRVVVLEQTNARYLEHLPEPVDLVTIDASFISLKLLLPVALGWLRDDGSRPPSPATRPSIVALVKPQFEAGRADVSRGEGVIRDPAVHQRVLDEVVAAAAALGLGLRGLIRSPLTGPKGNVEFLAWFTQG